MESLKRFDLSVEPSPTGKFVSFHDYDLLMREVLRLKDELARFDAIDSLSEDHHYIEQFTSAMQEIVKLESKVNALTVALIHIAKDCDPSEAREFAKNMLLHLKKYGEQ